MLNVNALARVTLIINLFWCQSVSLEICYEKNDKIKT